jgi:hypothetical protein
MVAKLDLNDAQIDKIYYKRSEFTKEIQNVKS